MTVEAADHDGRGTGAILARNGPKIEPFPGRGRRRTCRGAPLCSCEPRGPALTPTDSSDQPRPAEATEGPAENPPATTSLPPAGTSQVAAGEQPATESLAAQIKAAPPADSDRLAAQPGRLSGPAKTRLDAGGRDGREAQAKKGRETRARGEGRGARGEGQGTRDGGRGTRGEGRQSTPPPTPHALATEPSGPAEITPAALPVATAPAPRPAPPVAPPRRWPLVPRPPLPRPCPRWTWKPNWIGP